MIFMQFTFEDHTLVATRDASLWHVRICEHGTGSEKRYAWSDMVYASVMALAIDGDSVPGSAGMYEIVSCIDWGEDQLFRIIP